MSFPSNHHETESSYSPKPLEFTFPEIVLATDNFDESRLLGSGGFGDVYRGTINYEERLLDVAIKRLRPDSNEGVSGFKKREQAFWYEVTLHSHLRHPHLLSLIGYCSDGQEFIFIYDYMPRETLYHCLHKGGVPISWVRRLKICLEAARGLEYLHSETDTKSMVLHLDFKSSNILLASDWAAKVSDFGTSIVRPTDSTYETFHVPGTWGYRAPEFLLTGKATRKTDVFAFGVVMFEVLCVKEAVYRSISVEWKSLAASAQNSIEKRKLEEIIDPNLRGRISPKCLKEFAVLANRCLHSEPEQRPYMAEVVKDLESILALQNLQNKDDDKLLTKLFGARASSQKNSGNSVGSIPLKSLDKYLYNIGGEDRIVLRFSFDTILQATENFSEANRVFSGGYKFMYKGKLQNGQDITVAHYSDVDIDGYEELKNDASILVKLEHKNVIQLLGYCIDRRNVYLIYDFAFATLGCLIFHPFCNVLDWNKRHKIILGVARGLIYLHSYAPIQIIHFDLNPENILLDESFEPKLSGFRFATAANETDRIHFDQIRGTLGHNAPELLLECRLSTKADVFSFGVFVLNIVTGKKAFVPEAQKMLVDYVERNWLKGRLSNIVDPRIYVADSILMTNFMEIGLLCVQEIDVFRPTMEQVSAMLLGSLPLTLPISEMRARMMNGVSLYFCYNLDLDMDSPQLCDRFTVSDIKHATQNFDKSLVIGQGLCSTVYKGSFINGKRLFNVAVKRLKVSFSQEAELRAEVEILSKFKHPHLVSIFGYCGDEREIFLVYEYMPNGTLADHFQKGRAPLTWARRLKICLEVARCLDYLHSETDTKPSIIHDNVNCSTILLASNWAAKLSGFRFPNINLKSHLPIYEVSLLPPKFEYADTYYFQNRRVTRKSDVHSFGVVMLEVLCGKKTVYTSIDGERTRLRTWAEDSTKEGRLEKIMDPNLVGRVSSDCLKKFARLANRCLLDNPEQRPTMVEVVKDLESILDLEEKSSRTSLR